jgi:hypothetical protein
VGDRADGATANSSQSHESEASVGSKNRFSGRESGPHTGGTERPYNETDEG